MKRLMKMWKFDFEDSYGQNCLHLAVRNDRQEFIEQAVEDPKTSLVIRSLANKGIKKKNETPLFFALRFIEDTMRKEQMV